jgi:hypothetical protein
VGETCSQENPPCNRNQNVQEFNQHFHTNVMFISLSTQLYINFKQEVMEHHCDLTK